MGLLQLVLRATVFARMTPDQKTQLVDILQSIESVSPDFVALIDFVVNV